MNQVIDDFVKHRDKRPTRITVETVQDPPTEVWLRIEVEEDECHRTYKLTRKEAAELALLLTNVTKKGMPGGLCCTNL